MTVYMPDFLKHKECYFEDPRVSRYRLTDKATEKDVDSYIDFYLRPGYPYVLEPVLTVEQICKKIKEDVEDYIKNKERYTIEDNKLVAIDGKPVEVPEKSLVEILNSNGDFLD